MLALRLLRRRREEEPVHIKFLAWVALAILAVFLFLRFFEWIDKTKRSLLPLTTSLTILDDPSTLDTLVPLPTETFGAELYTAGTYRSAIGETPEGTVVTVYVKDDWRFVEIDYLPGIHTSEYLETHIYPTQEVKLEIQQSVWIQTMDDRPRCIDYEDELPNRCEISKHLLAEVGEWLLIISADGTHATNGELIEIARSILNAKTSL